MPFHIDGFLSAGLGKAFTEPTRQKFAAWFQLVEDLNRAGTHILPKLIPARSNVQQLFGALLYGRALTTYQGVVILAERGMLGDARTLVRSCAESAIAITAIAKDENFADRLIEGHQRHRLSVAHVLLRAPPTGEALTAEQITGLEGVIADVMAEHPERPDAVKWGTIATQHGLNVLYDTIYRDMSNDGTHVSLDSLNRHIRANEDGDIESLDFRPSSNGLDDVLSASVSSLLHAMDAAAQIFPNVDAGPVVKAYIKRWGEVLGFADGSIAPLTENQGSRSP